MRTAVFLLAAVALASGEDVTRTFDVSFLTESPGEGLTPAPSMQDPLRPASGDSMAEEEFTFSGDDVVEAVRAVTPADEAEPDIQFAAGLLTVRGSRAATERISAFLDVMTRAAKRRVVVDVEVLRLPAGGVAAAGAEAGTLAPGAEAKLRSTGTLAAVLRTAGHDGRRATAASTKDRTFVAGYEALVASKAAAMQPQVRTRRTGAVMEVVPILDGDGESALLDLRFALARPGEDFEFEGVQEPSRRVWSWEAALVVPTGRTLLAYSGGAEGVDGGGEIAVLVRVSPGGEPPGDFDAGGDAGTVRFASVGRICAPLFHRYGEDMGVPKVDDGTPPPEVAAEEAFVTGLDPEVVASALAGAAGDDTQQSLQFAGGRLRMKLPVPQLEVFAQKLRELCPERRLFEVEAAVVALSERAWLSRRDSLDEAAGRADFIEAAKRGEGSRFAAFVRGCGTCGQGFHAGAFSERPFVQTRDIEFAEGASVAAPRCAMLREGFRFRATLRPSAEKFAVDFDGWAAWGGAVAPSADAAGGPAQSAEAAEFRAVANGAVAPGDWTVAGVDLRAVAKGREARVMLYRVVPLEVK